MPLQQTIPTLTTFEVCISVSYSALKDVWSVVRGNSSVSLYSQLLPLMLLALLPFGFSVHAQSAADYVEFKGIISDRSGSPAPGALVTARDIRFPLHVLGLTTTTTLADGSLSIRLLRPAALRAGCQLAVGQSRSPSVTLLTPDMQGALRI